MLPRRKVAALGYGMADIARVHAEGRVPGMDDGTEERQAVQRELKLTGAVVVVLLVLYWIGLQLHSSVTRRLRIPFYRSALKRFETHCKEQPPVENTPQQSPPH